MYATDYVLQIITPIFFGLCFCILTVAAFIHSKAPAIVRGVAVPLALVLTICSTMAFISILGYSVIAELPAKFTVLGHRTLIVNGKKRDIEIWVRVDKNSRLYKIPFSKDMEKALEKAAEGRKRGLETEMKRKNDQDTGGAETDADTSGFTSDMKEPQHVTPKEPGGTAEPSTNADGFPTQPQQQVPFDRSQGMTL